MNAIAAALRRLPVVGEIFSATGLRWLSAALVAFVALLAVYSGVRSIASMGPQALQLQTSLDPLVRGIEGALGTESGALLGQGLDALRLETLMRQLVMGMLGLINQFGLVAIYVAFLLIDQTFFDAKMRVLFPDPARRQEATAFLTDLGARIGTYLSIMTRISAITAIISYGAMVLLGLENPVFWMLLIFLLNFIPTIGSILGAVLPAAFALVQFQDLWPAALLLIGLGSVQFVIGNVVLPRLTGKTFNLSLTATILSLAFWGALWGVTGMLLAVPVTAVLLLIASRFEATRPIAVMLSQTGDLVPAAEAAKPA